MAEDLREDAGEFYPGGTVVPGVPGVPGGGSSVEVVAPSPEGAGKAADAKAVYEELLEKVDKPTTPPNGVAYPSEVQLQNGGFYLLGANSSNNCNAYLPNVDSYEPQTFIIYCKDGTSSRFIDPLGRRIITNIYDGVFSDSVNFRLVGLPTKKFVSVTMRRVKADDGEEMIHLEIV
ncbi:MAG: hypothetical protein IKC27_09080 [Kiritimatiellae bacterium]|nr:hypothetical protein [Kiritimatiellia bacterium]